MNRFVWLLFFLFSTELFSNAQADVLPLPASIFEETLSESVSTAFEPRSSNDQARLELKDFDLVWQGAAPEGVKIEIVGRSLEWVRVANVLVLPRARVRVSATGVTGGMLENLNARQPLLSAGEGEWVAELPVVLATGKKNPIRLRLQRSGKELSFQSLLQYAPKDPVRANPVYIDASCSSENGMAKWQNLPQVPTWAYLGCRLTQSKRERQRTSNLEIYLFWDQPDSEILLAGNSIPETQPSLWFLKLRPHSGALPVESKAGALSLSHQAPEKVRYGSIGLGLGPYAYRFQTSQLNVDTTAPLLMVYGSYALTDSQRLTVFNATTVHRTLFMDTGLYFNSESFRTLDRRLSLYVMLGMNAIGFRNQGVSRFKLGAPQGFEAIYRDAFGRNWNLSAGAFIYPKINDQSYYNLWFRYGNRGRFLEVNYIAIQNEIAGTPFYTRSLGVSFGMPIARFL